MCILERMCILTKLYVFLAGGAQIAGQSQPAHTGGHRQERARYLLREAHHCLPWYVYVYIRDLCIHITPTCI